MSKLFEQLDELLQVHDYQLYDLEQNKSNNNLTLLIEHNDHPITIDDCVKVSQLVNEYLDQHEISEKTYMLDVCSPGVMRPLRTKKHYQAQLNHLITINLYQKDPVLKTKKITGQLEAVNDEGIVIDGSKFAFSEIAKAKKEFEGEK